MDKVYLSLLAEKLKSHQGKLISDMTNDEIQEYMNIRNEIASELQPLAETLAKALSPVIKAELKYNERVRGVRR